MRPRLYFDTHVVRNFEAWAADPTSLEKAQQATIAADHMADRIYEYFSARRPHVLRGSPTPGGYKRLVIDAEPDFQIVWDAARGLLPLGVCTLPALARKQNDDENPDAPLVAATLRNGQKVALRACVGKVIRYWEFMLRQQHL